MNRLLLAQQAEFDPVGFDPVQGYQPLSEKEQKARHILLHVSKASGKLVLKKAELIVQEVIPDTAMYRSQLINTFDLDPDNFYYSPQMEPGLSFEQIKDRLTLANMYLAQYLESKEHEPIARPVNKIFLAADGLHTVATELAFMYGVDSTELHSDRIQGN